MSRNLSRLLSCAFAAAALLAPASALHAQPKSFATKPVRLVIPFPAGGATDVVGRIVGQRLAERLGQPVVVDNRAGSGGGVGTRFVANSDPDGHTLLLTAMGPISIGPTLNPNSGYNVSDLAPVAVVFSYPMLIFVAQNSPYKTLKELIERGKPGRGNPLMYGSSGIGALSHLGGEMVNAAAGTNFQHVPYKGGAPLMLALLSGEVQWALIGTADAKPQNDKLRPLMVLAKERSAYYPNTPTSKESGFQDLEPFLWVGVLVSGKTPKPIVAYLNKTITEILQEPAIAARIKDLSADIGIPNNTPENFAAMIKAETPIYAKIIKATGAKAE
ncbi:MAG: tripartite tricarboxylate transporter substrate binding protein [Burkholderiaceae bacterium]|nr:tripartite tricarboxylate transporter substrate binding protein [Burkholderiaceae bacterium]